MLRRFLSLLLLAPALAGCGFLNGLPFAGNPELTPTAAPTQATAPTAVLSLSPAPAGSQPTTAPLPTVQPRPTLEPALSAAVSDQEALLVELYRRASPAVVSIDVVGNVGRALPEGQPAVPGGPDAPISQGSGFLFDDQGHIVTNNHVIEGARELQVTFYDGSSSTARVVGRDPDSDLAVIKVDELPPGAAPLPVGNSREVEVGQTAVAIGNPTH